ncbi:MAG TPA: hypothetical protein DCR04_04545, partial [Flavobacteriales bacterium]|nr:hypothetical protein [Flavobacteriales bacterium]
MKKLIIFIVLTVLVGLFGVYQGNRVTHQLEHHGTEKIQADILALDKTIQAQLKEINDSKIGLQSLYDKWDKKGIGFVIYNENEIADWTTNGIPFEIEFDSRQPPKQGIINLKNAWYLSRSIQIDNQLLVAYALLRTDYGFENRYISNRWNPSIHAEPQLTFTLASPESTIELTDGVSPVGLRFLPKKNGEAAPSWNSIVWLAFLLLLLLSIWHAGNWIEKFSSKTASAVIFVSLVLIIRMLLFWLELPRALYQLELFGPTLHATSSFIPSLGDFVLHL